MSRNRRHTSLLVPRRRVGERNEPWMATRSPIKKHHKTQERFEKVEVAVGLSVGKDDGHDLLREIARRLRSARRR